MTAGEAQQRRALHYSGWVQGVGFRYTARQLASRWPVTGFVRNLSDGRVQLVVEGLPLDIEALLAAIHREMHEQISDVAATTGPATGEFCGFEIRR